MKKKVVLGMLALVTGSLMAGSLLTGSAYADHGYRNNHYRYNQRVSWQHRPLFNNGRHLGYSRNQNWHRPYFRQQVASRGWFGNRYYNAPQRSNRWFW